jgi:uncharacterized protein YjbI with pentapeptide repeats
LIYKRLEKFDLQKISLAGANLNFADLTGANLKKTRSQEVKKRIGVE